MARRSSASKRSRPILFGLLPSLPRKRRRPAARIALPTLPRVPVATPALRKAVTRPAIRRPAPGRWLHSRHVGPAGSRSYDVYLPAGHRRATRMPLVVLLHGCNQTSEEFVAATRFTALADRHGFLIAAPAADPRSPTRRLLALVRVRAPGARRGRAGHSGRHHGGVAGRADPMADRLRPRLRRRHLGRGSDGADPRRHLSGRVRRGRRALGPAYRSATSGRRAFGAMRGRGAPTPPLPGAQMAPLIVVQGTTDAVVHERGGRLMVEQWLAYDAARCTGARGSAAHHPVPRQRRSAPPTVAGTPSRAGIPRPAASDSSTGGSNGLGHAWSGGVADGSYSDPKGPRASTAMWQFFASHTV